MVLGSPVLLTRGDGIFFLNGWSVDPHKAWDILFLFFFIIIIDFYRKFYS